LKTYNNVIDIKRISGECDSLHTVNFFEKELIPESAIEGDYNRRTPFLE